MLGAAMVTGVRRGTGEGRVAREQIMVRARRAWLPLMAAALMQVPRVEPSRGKAKVEP